MHENINAKERNARQTIKNLDLLKSRRRALAHLRHHTDRHRYRTCLVASSLTATVAGSRSGDSDGALAYGTAEALSCHGFTPVLRTCITVDSRRICVVTKVMSIVIKPVSSTCERHRRISSGSAPNVGVDSCA